LGKFSVRWKCINWVLTNRKKGMHVWDEVTQKTPGVGGAGVRVCVCVCVCSGEGCYHNSQRADGCICEARSWRSELHRQMHRGHEGIPQVGNRTTAQGGSDLTTEKGVMVGSPGSGWTAGLAEDMWGGRHPMCQCCVQALCTMHTSNRLPRALTLSGGLWL
jgi:hypothetical protein